jgi:hypothetical protein
MSASKVTVRPATEADLKQFAPSFHSVRAMAMEVDGKVVGIGGVALVNGRWLAFIDALDEAREHGVVAARHIKTFLAQLRKEGVKFVYAARDENEPKAKRLLTWLGFETDPRTLKLVRWRG